MKVFKCAKVLCSTIAILLMLILLLMAVLTGSTAQADPACVATDSGDLVEEIKKISDQVPGPGSNGMRLPTEDEMGAWEDIIIYLVNDNLVEACRVISDNSFPYRIIRYTDTGNDGESYLMLKEDLPISVGWGTYVIKSDGCRDVVIEIPHPRHDLHTDEQGAEIFRQINARALLMAGTHRCANNAYSPCDGTTTACDGQERYRESDVAHATQTMFDVSHRVLVACGGNTVAVQIHGHGDSNCPDLFISNGTCITGELTSQLYTNAVTECNDTFDAPPFSADVADCNEPECSRRGSTNVQGRYSNGCSTPEHDPCTTPVPGPSNPEQFIHLEQSLRLRQQNYACLIADLKATFPCLSLTVTKQADPDPVQAGSQLTYTIRVTNTGSVDLHATVTDTLPNHVTPTGVLTWARTITAPYGIWMKQFTVTVEMDYIGPLVNVVEVTTEEGATGIYTETSISGYIIYLPIILKNH